MRTFHVLTVFLFAASGSKAPVPGEAPDTTTGTRQKVQRAPAPGYRHAHYGTLCSVGYSGYSWSSSFTGTGTYRLYFHYDGIGSNYGNCRAYGFQLRCLQE